MEETESSNSSVWRIQRHHRIQGTDQHWTRERFYRLCQLLQCTPEELAAMFCVTVVRLNGWLKKDQIPPYWALHLVLLEQAFWRAKYGARAVPLLPHELLDEKENQKER